MSHYFQRHGFEVDCAADPEAARLYLGEREYALAIVDIHLVGRAGCDGLDLAEFICHERPATAVVIMTAMATAEHEQRAARIGVRSLVRKPARLAHVANVVFGLLGRIPVAAL